MKKTNKNDPWIIRCKGRKDAFRFATECIEEYLHAGEKIGMTQDKKAEHYQVIVFKTGNFETHNFTY